MVFFLVCDRYAFIQLKKRRRELISGFIFLTLAKLYQHTYFYAIVFDNNLPLEADIMKYGIKWISGNVAFSPFRNAYRKFVFRRSNSYDY